MARRNTSGLSTQTVNRIVVNAGALYMNLGLPDERLLGATRDGVTFVIEQDIAEMELDGTAGPTMGFRRAIEVRPRIESTILEMTPENLKLAIVGSDTSEYIDGDAIEPTHTEISRNRGIAMSDYIPNIAIVGTMAGSDENIIITIFNALMDGEISMESADAGEAGLPVTFTGHFDPSNMEVEPWSIRIPKDVSSVTAPIE